MPFDYVRAPGGLRNHSRPQPNLAGEFGAWEWEVTHTLLAGPPAFVTHASSKIFAFSRDAPHRELRMKQPVALLLYEKLLPGSQVGNRLRDLGYRVETVLETKRLVEVAESLLPLVVLLDLESTSVDTCALLRDLRRSPEAGHVPVLAFAGQNNEPLRQAASAAGATLVTSEDAMLPQLPVLLEQTLRVE